MQLPTTLDSVGDTELALASPLAEMQAQAPVSEAVTDMAVAEIPAPAPVVVAAPVAVVSVPAPTSALGTMAPSTPATWPMLGALLLVVGLILVLGKVMKHLQNRQGAKAGALTIKGGVNVGGKERVVWMQAGETHLLLGVSPGRVQTLHVFDVPPDFSPVAVAATESAATTPASADFSARLKTLLEHARAKGIDTEVAAPVAAPPVAAAPAKPTAATSKPTFSFRA